MPVMELLWFAIIVVAMIVEAATATLFSIWFAGGALVALVSAFLGAPEWLQIVLFLVVSAGLLAATRPLAKKFINSRKQATNFDRIIGTTCPVTEAVDNREGHGAVYVDGKHWSARSDSGEKIPEGSNVEIIRIEGVKVIVRPAE